MRKNPMRNDTAVMASLCIEREKKMCEKTVEKNCSYLSNASARKKLMMNSMRKNS